MVTRFAVTSWEAGVGSELRRLLRPVAEAVATKLDLLGQIHSGVEHFLSNKAFTPYHGPFKKQSSNSLWAVHSFGQDTLSVPLVSRRASRRRLRRSTLPLWRPWRGHPQGGPSKGCQGSLRKGGGSPRKPKRILGNGGNGGGGSLRNLKEPPKNPKDSSGSQLPTHLVPPPGWGSADRPIGPRLFPGPEALKICAVNKIV